jgi:hypothetical protein
MRSKLLPYSCKIVGLLIFFLAFMSPIVMGMLHPQSWEQTEPGRQIANTIMLIGLLLFILSKEKIEDEFVDFCRLRAFRAALITGIIYYLQDAFGTFKGNIVSSSFGLLIMELLVYVVIFYVAKAGLINGK